MSPQRLGALPSFAHEDGVGIGHERALGADGGDALQPHLPADVGRASPFDEGADGGARTRGHPSRPVQQPRLRRARQAPRELGELPVVARHQAARRLLAPDRAAQVEDGGADSGERVEAAHAVHAHPRALEQAQEVRVGVLRHDHQVGRQGEEALHLRPAESRHSRRHAAHDVGGAGVVGRRRGRHQPLDGDDLHQDLVGGEVHGGDTQRNGFKRRGRRGRREKE